MKGSRSTPPGKSHGPRPEAPQFRGHGVPRSPLVFRKMITSPGDRVANGAWTELLDREGRLVGRGFFNRKSEIAFRMIGGADEPADLRELLTLRLSRADHLRTQILGLSHRTNAWRWVHAEGDGLSGLIIDRYGEVVVVGVYSRGWVAHAELLEAVLLRFEGVRSVVFVADDQIAKQEGFHLPPVTNQRPISIREGDLSFRVDWQQGHKTGLFLDQREHRARLAQLVRGCRVLDLCTNAGGFALSADKLGGAKTVEAIDLDEKVLELARANAERNGSRVRFTHADLFPWLRDRIAAADRFDVIVLDPPKLARGPKELDAGLKRYRDMNRLAFQALEPGGLLYTFSCSGVVSETDFLAAVRRAAEEARRPARFLEVTGAAPDHPVAFDFPEGRYLKGALIQVD